MRAFITTVDRVFFYAAFGGMLMATGIHQIYANSRSANPVAPNFSKQNPEVQAYETRGVMRQFKMLEYQAKHLEGKK